MLEPLQYISTSGLIAITSKSFAYHANCSQLIHDKWNSMHLVYKDQGLVRSTQTVLPLESHHRTRQRLCLGRADGPIMTNFTCAPKRLADVFARGQLGTPDVGLYRP